MPTKRVALMTNEGVDKDTLDAANKMLDQVKIDLMSRKNTVFVATIAFSLQHVFTRSIPTAATDGFYIYYNPDFMLSLTPAVRLFVMLHETWHVAFKHCALLNGSRLGTKNKIVFNIAADYVINVMMQQAGYQIWSHALVDLKYIEMSTEQVYTELMKNPEVPLVYQSADKPDEVIIVDNEGEGHSSDDDSNKDSGNNNDEDKSDDASKKAPNSYDGDILANDSGNDEDTDGEFINNILIKAAMQANMANNDPGSIPGEIGVAIGKLVSPKLSWDRVLHKYFTDKITTDYSFQRPNRRFMPKHYLPSAKTVTAGRVGIAVDMSASVTDTEINQFVSDAASVLLKCPIKRFTLIQFDTQVFAEDDITSVQELEAIEFAGRGGTDIDPPLRWAHEHRQSLDCFLIFTDGMFYAPTLTPAVPVVWVVHNYADFAPEFGKVIHYKM